jgi:predicted small metal-binding protein
LRILNIYLVIKERRRICLNSFRRYSLSCRELGVDDDFVCSGKSRADVIIRMLRYVRRVHGLALEDLWGYRIRQTMV